MGWNTVTKAEVINIETGEKEVVILKEWARKHGLSNDCCYSASKRNSTYKGYRFKWLGTVEVDPNRISETIKKHIVNLYRSGTSIDALKRRFHLSHTRITNVLHDAGIVTPERTRPEAKVEWADREIDDEGKFRALVKAGWLSGNIAVEFSTSIAKVEEKKRELNL